MNALWMFADATLSLLALVVGSEAEGTDSLLEYARFLREETQAHRAYLENLLTASATIVGMGIAVLAAILGFLGLRTFRGTAEAVKNAADAAVKNAAKDAERAFDTALKQELGDEFNKFKLELANQQQSLKEHVRKFTGNLEDLRTQTKANVAKTATDMVDLLQALPQGVKAEVIYPKARSEQRILWVDDVPENNVVPHRIFQQVGFIVEAVQSTPEAVQKLKEDRFDLVISDMGRGHKTDAGLELLELIRASWPKTRVVIYASEKALEHYGARAKELGAARCINGSSELISTVYELLDFDPTHA